jgi:4a-hydroxytetrahydrobiopterin dehydratase
MIGALNSGWELVYKDDVENLTKTFEVADFVTAMALVNKVADLAESQNHHPAILIEYNKVSITTTTHSAGNRVTEKDEALVLAIEELI